MMYPERQPDIDPCTAEEKAAVLTKFRANLKEMAQELVDTFDPCKELEFTLKDLIGARQFSGNLFNQTPVVDLNAERDERWPAEEVFVRIHCRNCRRETIRAIDADEYQNDPVVACPLCDSQRVRATETTEQDFRAYNPEKK